MRMDIATSNFLEKVDEPTESIPIAISSEIRDPKK